MSAVAQVSETVVPRDVVLGRTQHVRRLLPGRARRTIGAWCFLDHFGPDRVDDTGGLWVPPHPHVGLQTVTWLLEGSVRHTDSLGSDQLIRPGQLNVMTSGDGVAHAEVTAPDASASDGSDASAVLHGVQLWVALPDAVRASTPADFTHLADLPSYTEGGVDLTVVVGSLLGESSRAPAFSPLLAVQMTLEPGSEATLPLEPGFEHGVLPLDGAVLVGDARLSGQRLGYLPEGSGELTLAAPDEGARVHVLLIGGAPFEEDLVMWWNFVARSHEEVVGAREAWNAGGVEAVPPRYGAVAGFAGDRLLAPPMPTVRLTPRGRAPRARSGRLAAFA